MQTNRITPGPGQPPQIAGTQSRDGEEAFHDLAKSEEDAQSYKTSIQEGTRLTRGKRGERSKKSSSLFKVTGNEDEEQEPVYRTVMVDGMPFTLRLLAVA